MDEQTKNLLKSWNLRELIPYFEDEGVDVSVFQMMKPHHVMDLLKNFKFGTRVRFEHHLEQWRRDMGRPLKNIKQHYSFRNSSLNDEEPTAPTTAGKKVMTRATNTELPKLANASTCTSSLPIQKLPVPSSIEDFTEFTDSPPQSQATSTLRMGMSGMDRPFSLKKILTETGPSATSLVEYYKEHNELTLPMRAQLIQIIVSFFERHELHLSLQMSHNLEQQILKLFPTEKLENYRTEKRGKIYVKYNNMKRYKREKSLQMEKRQCLDPNEQSSAEQSNSNMAVDEFIITDYLDPVSSGLVIKNEEHSNGSWE